MENRLDGSRRLYGTPGYEFIVQAHIAVVGLGGVGSWAAEALARAGVGQLTLVDMDAICPSNTNRQLHALTSTFGKPKVEVMADRIAEINPRCRVHIIHDLISKHTLHYLPEDLDYVIDAIDSVKHKAAMIHYCSRKKIPIMCAGGAAGKTDPTAVAIKDLNRTRNDPLLAKVRSFLRRYYGFSSNPKRRFGIRCVYSCEQVRYPQPDGSISSKRAPEKEGTMLGCEGGLGQSMCVTATFGLVAASFALNKIVEKGLRAKTL
ncbi:MAG: tRNA cyclic N6-threonylcarbamoyladenosine(37) synthase TcdA [Acidobacteria bacterium]|nr:MAG: tRNA cyclic N6-threonylcarbamoyladenosine(37) synthase TcdA [Acidobacteriota bacterium]